MPSLYYIEINFLFIFQCWILHSGWSGTWKIVVDSNQQLQWHDYRAWPCPLCTPFVNVWFWRPSGHGRLRTYSSHVFTNPEFSICIFFFEKFFVFSIKKIAVMLAFFNLFWFLNENPFTTDQSKRQISWKKFRFRRFRIREIMWWTRYRFFFWNIVKLQKLYDHPMTTR